MDKQGLPSLVASFTPVHGSNGCGAYNNGNIYDITQNVNLQLKLELFQSISNRNNSIESIKNVCFTCLNFKVKRKF